MSSDVYPSLPGNAPSAMSRDIHMAVTKASIGTAQLRQHEVLLLEGDNTLVLVTALSAPRLWGRLLDNALEGFLEGLSRPHDGRASTRLHQALDGTQKRMRLLADNLIERRVPDVGLLALTLEGKLLHVLCLGPARAYLHRRRSIRRLSPRDDRAEGVLKATPTWCAEELEAGDLLFAGSLTAFGEEALHTLRAQLESGYLMPPRKVVEDLNKPAAAAGIGAAAMAFRTSNF
jgi:hypothetical protein